MCPALHCGHCYSASSLTICWISHPHHTCHLQPHHLAHVLGRVLQAIALVAVRLVNNKARALARHPGLDATWHLQPSPLARALQAIALVAVRLVNNRGGAGHLAAWRQMAAGRQVFGQGSGSDMPEAVGEELYKVVASTALQFQGHMSDMDLMQV